MWYVSVLYHFEDWLVCGGVEEYDAQDLEDALTFIRSLGHGGLINICSSIDCFIEGEKLVELQDCSAGLVLEMGDCSLHIDYDWEKRKLSGYDYITDDCFDRDQKQMVDRVLEEILSIDQ